MIYATITYNTRAQKDKKGSFSNILTPSILKDICFRLTGQSVYIEVKKYESYNKGRLVLVEYDGIKHFVSLSNLRLPGRNASVQSVATAFNLYFQDSASHKHLWYYFLPDTPNKITEYQTLYLRLMRTCGFTFLNSDSFPNLNSTSFNNIEEMIEERDNLRKKNRGNKSTFVTKELNIVKLYAKTYGASKYESTMFAIAASKIYDGPIDLVSVYEGGLKCLPKSSLITLKSFKNINIISVSLSIPPSTFTDKNDAFKLRSNAFHYNLLDRLRVKKCAFCDCNIQEIIQGAHIWGVAHIKRETYLSPDQQYSDAINAHNGLWLCPNHHILFDRHILAINENGSIIHNSALSKSQSMFLSQITPVRALDKSIITEQFKIFLSKRNKNINLDSFIGFD